MDSLIPNVVIYVGLAGTLLALIVATATNGWKASVFFLLVLRLAIGWHFLFEGLNKIESHYGDGKLNNRPFSSEPYFREAAGPLGPVMRENLGIADWDRIINEKVTPKEKLTNSATNDELRASLPEAVDQEWDQFRKAFKEKYNLTQEEWARLDGEQSEAEAQEFKNKKGPGDLTLNAKLQYAEWLQSETTRDTTLSDVSGDTPLNVKQRKGMIETRKADYENFLQRRKMGMGQGEGTDATRVKEAREAWIQSQADLVTDAQNFLNDLKSQVVTYILNERVDSFLKTPTDFVRVGEGKNSRFDDAKLQELLPNNLDQANAGFDDLPQPLQSIWADYKNGFLETYPLTEEQKKNIENAYEVQNQRLANMIFGRNEFRGNVKEQNEFLEHVKRYRELLNSSDKKDKGSLIVARDVVLADLETKFDQLRAALNTATPSDLITPTKLTTPDKPKPTEWLDIVTMWTLTCVGAMLMAGLLTPVNIIIAAGFLLMTYLAHPPFPWLVQPPATEGNPVFINKNAIEFFALLVLLCYPTSKWMGLDALFHRLFFGRKRGATVTTKTMTIR